MNCATLVPCFKASAAAVDRASESLAAEGKARTNGSVARPFRLLRSENCLPLQARRDTKAYMSRVTNVDPRNMTFAGHSILSFSLDDWTAVWRSRHHVMSQLAKHNRVLYVSPPFYVRDVLRDLGSATGRPSGIVKVGDNLHSYVPPRWLPDSYRYPALDRLIKNWRYRHIRRAMTRLGMSRPILYVWHPAFVDVVGKFDESLVVYHVYDEYASFETEPEKRDLLLAQERQLLAKADIVFTVSEELTARRQPFNANTHTVQNAVDFGLFSKAREAATRIPDDLLAIRGPVIGCVMTQTPFMELALLHEVFRRRPDWSFVFLGAEKAPSETASAPLNALQALPNVHFIGRRNRIDIPRYLKGFDVCAIPYILNDVTVVGSPLKLYEYMAAGKPIVCTPLPLLQHLDDVIAFATDADEWIRAIESALQDDGVKRIAQRQALAAENTWEQRVAFISSKMTERLRAKPR